MGGGRAGPADGHTRCRASGRPARLNGIFWRLRTGAPWADIPARYGPRTTCGNRFRRWRKAGVWDRLLDAVSMAYDGDILMIDATSVRVHQHAATAKKEDDLSRCMGRLILRLSKDARRPDHQDSCPGGCRGPPHRSQADRGAGP